MVSTPALAAALLTDSAQADTGPLCNPPKWRSDGSQINPDLYAEGFTVHYGENTAICLNPTIWDNRYAICGGEILLPNGEAVQPSAGHDYDEVTPLGSTRYVVGKFEKDGRVYYEIVDAGRHTDSLDLLGEHRVTTSVHGKWVEQIDNESVAVMMTVLHEDSGEVVQVYDILDGEGRSLLKLAAARYDDDDADNLLSHIPWATQLSVDGVAVIYRVSDRAKLYHITGSLPSGARHSLDLDADGNLVRTTLPR